MNHAIEKLTAEQCRAQWMKLLGYDQSFIEASLRYDRPQSVEEERHLLESVLLMLQGEEEEHACAN